MDVFLLNIYNYYTVPHSVINAGHKLNYNIIRLVRAMLPCSTAAVFLNCLTGFRRFLQPCPVAININVLNTEISKCDMYAHFKNFVLS